MDAEKRRLWLRRLGLGLGALAVLLVVLYFVLTSSFFLKAVVVPRVGAALQAKLEVGEVALSPFSGVTLRQFRLTTTGQEPLAQADEATVRYDSLFALIKGRIELAEVTLVKPRIAVVQTPGHSNLDPLLQPRTAAATPSAEAAGPLVVNLRKLTIQDGALSLVQVAKDGSRQTSEVDALRVEVARVGNGQTGQATLGAGLRFATQPVAGSTNRPGLVQAKLDGSIDFALDSKLRPNTLKGALALVVSEGQGAFAEIKSLKGSLTCEATPTEVKQALLRFEKEGRALGQVEVSGPFDLVKTEARLKLTVSAIDRNVLNLFGATLGLDFGETAINAACVAEVSRRGELVAGQGKISVAKLSIRQAALATPPVDLDLDCQFTVNVPDKNAVVQKFNLQGQQRQKPWVKLVLDRPMNLAWGENVHGLNDATVAFELADLNLADWQAFLGTNEIAGRLSALGSLTAKQDGRRLSLDLTSTLTNLAARYGTNQVQQASARVQVRGQFDDFKTLLIERFSLDAAQHGTPLLTANGSVSYKLDSGESRVQLNAESELPNVVKEFPVAGLSASAGKLKATALVSQARAAQQATVNLTLAGFTGRFQDYAFRDYQVSLESDAEIKGRKLSLSRATLGFRQAYESGGSLDAGGTYDLENAAGDFTFNVATLNQVALAPVLAPALAPYSLVSAALSAKGKARYTKTEIGLQCSATLSKFLLAGPADKLPKQALEAQLELDVVKDPKLASIRNLLLSLTPGTPGKNEIRLQGSFDPQARAGELSFSVADLNEQGLRPLLAPALAPNTLSSVSVNSKGTVRLDPAKAGVVQVSMDLARLVIRDAQKRPLTDPLGLKLELEAAQTQARVDVRKALLSLDPTARAKNQLQLEGRLDLAATNPLPSQIKLTAESLDLTPFYDLWASNRTGAAARPGPSQAAPPAAGKRAEPDPVKLPLRQLAADLKIDRLYLREVAISNWVGSLQVDQGRVSLKPFQLVLNGAPAKLETTLDLSKPGYVYDLDLKVDGLRLEPLVNSFAPEKRGQLEGLVFASGRLAGAGVTDANLQKNLRGNLSFTVTNMNLQVVGPRMQGLLAPIAIVLQAPELRETPIYQISGQLAMGNALAELQQFAAASPAFYSVVQGNIQLAEVLTNSPLNLPVQLALRRNLAERAKMLPANAPADAPYVWLPQFVTVKGTLGNPKSEPDKAKIGGQVLDTAGQLIGGKVGSALQGAGGLFKGDLPFLPKASTNAPLPQAPTPPKSTPKTNAPPTNSLLNLLPGLLQPRR